MQASGLRRCRGGSDPLLGVVEAALVVVDAREREVQVAGDLVAVVSQLLVAGLS